MRKTGALLLLSSTLLPAQLSFNKIEDTYEIPAEAETFQISVPFTAEGDTSLKEIDEKCSCMKGVFSEEKKSWRAGERGTLILTLDPSLIKKSSEKSLEVHFQKQPSQSLTFNLVVPVGISSDVNKKRWKVGEEKTPKDFLIEISPEFNFDLERISQTNPSFTFQLIPEKREKGKAYKLSVTPGDTSEKGFCLFKIETDSEIPRYQTLSVIALVE